MERTKPWELSDDLWQRVEPLIPHVGKQQTGRPDKSDWAMLGAMLYVLQTGMQWNALPREVGARTTVYDRFQLWLEARFFQRMWEAGLQEFDEGVGIDAGWSNACTPGSIGRGGYSYAGRNARIPISPSFTLPARSSVFSRIVFSPLAFPNKLYYYSRS